MADALFDESTPTIQDPFAGEVAIRLVGDFGRGGTVEFFFRNERVDGPLPVPQTEWAAFALLVEGALKMSRLGGFFRSKQLAAALAKHRVVDIADSLNAVRIVYRLRKRLNRLNVAAKLVAAGYLQKVDEFAEHLIPTWPVLGYTLSLPPERLAIHFVDPD